MGFVVLVMDTVVCLTLAKWETVSGQFGGYLKARLPARRYLREQLQPTDNATVSRKTTETIRLHGWFGVHLFT